MSDKYNDRIEITADNYVGHQNYCRVRDLIDIAKNADHPYWFKGYPVLKETYYFINAIREKRYDIHPAIDKYDIYTRPSEGDNFRVYNQVSVVYPDAPQVRVGMVGFDPSGPNYFVQSDKIRNEKFKSGSEGYRIRQSQDMKKALKVALQFLKPFTFTDMFNTYKHDLRYAIERVRYPAETALREKFSIGNAVIMNEVQHMLVAGYQPVTKQFAEALALLQGEGSELNRMRHYAPRSCFVWVKRSSLAYQFVDESNTVEVTTMDELPQWLREKLAVLNIAEEETTIADVGTRLNANAFWVFV
jgi:hypothetical protein